MGGLILSCRGEKQRAISFRQVRWFLALPLPPSLFFLTNSPVGENREWFYPGKTYVKVSRKKPRYKQHVESPVAALLEVNMEKMRKKPCVFSPVVTLLETNRRNKLHMVFLYVFLNISRNFTSSGPCPLLQLTSI